jgi:regulator of RNase E activity RraA
MSTETIKRLLGLDSCAVSDALDSAGLPAAIVGLVPLTVRRRIAGPALTIRLGPAAPAGGSTRHLGTTAIEAARGGEIIVIEHSTGIECAGWGGVLSAGAMVRDVAGVVIDGPARDIDEAVEVNFPVYGRSPIARTARGRVWEQSSNETIEIGNITVNPGDWVLADASGVVFVPAERLDEILERGERIMQKERLMAAALKDGDRITEVLGRDYEEMLDGLD